MKPTQVLVEEHNAIKVMLQIIEKINKAIESGKKLDANDLEKVVSLIQEFADACHHRKEEGFLFPAMEQAGIPRQGGPIGVMLQDHEQGRNYVKGMKEALKNMDDPQNRKQFVEEASGYVRLLKQHIDKEDNILYPTAEKKLSKTSMQKLIEEFERVEREETGEGIHEKYHQVLHKLKDRYLLH